MKQLTTSLFVAALLASSLVGIQPAQAGATPVNNAIRGSADTVYWYASNGKRYVFPDAQTYLSWYPNFNNVIRTTDYELSLIPLGGNVTYRPGARLVKIQSDPKVYAVSRYGVLRWVTGESLASQLYGANWGSAVRDISASFFTNYTIGSPIWTSSDYNVSSEYNSVATPNDNIGAGTVLGTNTFGGFTSATYLTGGVTSRSTSGNTETITFTANVYNANTDVGNIRIDLMDNSNNSILRSCSGTNYCSVNVASSLNTTRTFTARAWDQYNHQVSASPIVVNYGGGTGNTTNANLTVDRTAIVSGESVTLNFTITNVTVSPSRIEIKDTRTNTLVRTCFTSTSCTVTTPVFSTNNLVGEVVQFSGIAYDSNNAAIASANAPLVTIGNANTQSGTVFVSADRTTVNGGDSVQFTATAQNVTGSISNLTVRLYDERNGNLLNTCYGTTTCSSWVTTTTGNQYTFRVYGEATNANGQTFTRGYSPTILVNGGSQTTGTLTVSANRTVANNGETVVFTAQATNITGNIGNLTIRLTDERTGNVVSTCSGATSCSASVYPTSGSYTFRVYADVTSTSNGQSFSRAYSPIVSVNSGGCTGNCGGSFTGTLTLSADRTTVRLGERVTLTSTLSGVNVSYNDITIRYYDSRTGAQVAECRTNGANCFPNPLITGNTGTMQFSAIATDPQGRTLPTAWTQTITVLP